MAARTHHTTSKPVEETTHVVESSDQLISSEERRLEADVKQFVNLEESSPANNSQNPPKLIVFLTTVLFISGIVVFAFALKSSGISLNTGNSQSTTPTPSPAPTTAPTATPVPIKKSDLKINILNGSGKPGLAGIAKTYLESLGYQNITTGNADSYDYPNTTITFKNKSEAATQLKADLSQKYTVTESTTSSTSTDSDVEIVLGAK